MTKTKEVPFNYDALMQAHLYRVLAERDVEKRRAAIRELYAEAVVVYEPGVEANGHDGVDHTVDAILSKAPPSFVFGTFGPAVGHHGVGRMRWHFGPAEGPPVVTGLDVVEIVDGKITKLYVFLDPTPA
ncbi:nuclear transport factor 2 family protein [Xanthomonas arboricola]|uniref:SnoaL-like domain-containing protein n=1 Tax=Xanthomonas arboricola pv. corylina TaxID=487821 RepID=A0ABM8RZB2_9XANT|nr:nuclear transport factor 2 family protein [Xanthomonas arboricola]MDN0209262.1 nuclear transport factor 2 family protein [Xanthomonas arboricola pv. corylina]MDN0213653.1 nuclear transport factor 2 family protein [Xanthomonas arboricola pv. corylina]QUI82631.1 nuclear transport factor 2 family protein [Xanthomonas arboricola pv. corylina]UQQ12701.1 nuclear transport factor 2 family protein [Xanthomonas arboricola pv. corylina]WIX25310.1 nuclear transport factor 2 family protein [Xanthomonas